MQLPSDFATTIPRQSISGCCGRLMCCLTYEHDAYLAARKRFPREGKIIRTSRGSEKVIGVDIWRDLVTLLDEQRQRRVVGLAELRAEWATVPREPATAAAAAAPATIAPAPEDKVITVPEGDAAAARKRKRRRR